MGSDRLAAERRVFIVVIIAVIVGGTAEGPFLAVATGQPWWIFSGQIAIAIGMSVWYDSIKRRGRRRKRSPN